jgi:hypothetical protein
MGAAPKLEKLVFLGCDSVLLSNRSPMISKDYVLSKRCHFSEEWIPTIPLS